MKTDRSDIIDKVHNRFDGEIPKLIINDAIEIICEHLSDSLVNDQSVSIHNFGTLHTFILSGHLGTNVVSGELQYVKPKKNVRFSPHVTLTKLVEEKKSFFKGDNS